ncbi:MAG: hypothetical protein U0401_03290 [Anaerolineae bacterium]
MRDWLISRSGGSEPEEAWEARLRRTAQAFPYPPTPDVAGAVQKRLAEESRVKPGFWASSRSRLTWAALIVLLILGGLLAVPQVRARVIEFLQIGAIRILLGEPTPAPSPGPHTPTPLPSPTPLASLLDLAGETTLAEAEQGAGFPIRLPAYPAGLGLPERVFLQDMNGPVVVLVWLDPIRPGGVRFSLHQFGPGTFAEKGNPAAVQEAQVNGQRAIWAEGPYLLQIRRGSEVDYDLRRLVEGRVLIWTEGEITFRLESDLTLEEAIKVAESLR